MLIPLQLNFLLIFSGFFLIPFLFDLELMDVTPHIAVSLGYGALASTFIPNVLDNVQDFSIYLPWHSTEQVEDVRYSADIGVTNCALLLFGATITHDRCGPQVVPTNFMVDPRCRFGYSWQRAVHVQKQAVLLLDFGD